MSKLGISTGTTPNDGNGDSLLSGAVKINSNFDEIYSFFGDGTNLTGAGVTYITAGSGISVDQNTGNVTITATGGGGGGGGGGGSVSISSVAPLSPNGGDLWYSIDYGRTFVYYDEVALGIGSTAVWVDAAPFNINLSQLDDLQVNSLVVVNNTDLNTLDVSGISTFNGNITVAGIITASVGSSSGIVTYYGDTSNAVDGRWILGASGTSDYTFTGIGFTQTTNDPVLYLARGRVYEFVNNSGGAHPFEIRVSNSGVAYNDGVTNNAAVTGVIRFEVPMNAPNTLYYQCTVHSGMGNTISVYPNTI